MTLSTIYFGPENDSQSIDHLQTMAHEGQGQFVDTNQLGASGDTMTLSISLAMSMGTK